MERLEKDLASAEIAATLDENLRLARELGIKGTPAYVVGDAVVPGAVGVAALRERIRAARR
jgi:protein-disulfide isomerase